MAKTYSTTAFVIETDEENPALVARISEGRIEVMDGLVVRPMIGNEMLANHFANAERYDMYYINQRLGKSQQ